MYSSATDNSDMSMNINVLFIVYLLEKILLEIEISQIINEMLVLDLYLCSCATGRCYGETQNTVHTRKNTSQDRTSFKKTSAQNMLR